MEELLHKFLDLQNDFEYFFVDLEASLNKHVPPPSELPIIRDNDYGQDIPELESATGIITETETNPQEGAINVMKDSMEMITSLRGMASAPILAQNETKGKKVAVSSDESFLLQKSIAMSSFKSTHALTL
jgi:hypothetical protein